AGGRAPPPRGGRRAPGGGAAPPGRVPRRIRGVAGVGHGAGPEWTVADRPPRRPDPAGRRGAACALNIDTAYARAVATSATTPSSSTTAAATAALTAGGCEPIPSRPTNSSRRPHR